MRAHGHGFLLLLLWHLFHGEVVDSAEVPRANPGGGQALFRLPYRQMVWSAA